MTDKPIRALTDEELEAISIMVGQERMNRENGTPKPTDTYCINVQGEKREEDTIRVDIPISLHCETFEREEVKGVGI